MTTRAPGVCREPGCLQPPQPGRATCRQHSAAPWAGSSDTRRGLTPSPAAYHRLRRAIRRRSRGRCERCGQPATPGQVDHRRPVALGGTTTPENLWVLCDRCATQKTRADLAAIRQHDLALAANPSR